MKILFPTDLSEESFNMIERLLPKLLSKDIETEFILFHVVDNSHYGATSVGDLSQVLHEDAVGKLTSYEKKLIETHGVSVV